MHYKPRFRNSSFTVWVEPADQLRLKQFAQHELVFYNTIIEAMESRTRAFSKQVAEATDAQIQIMCDSMITKQLPASGALPDWMQFVTQQILKPKLAVLPECKHMMTRSLMQFFREQAVILKDPINNDKLEISYKVAPQNLSKLDSTTKRHLQIPRSCVRVQWDPAQEVSLIHTQLTTMPLKVPNVNLNENEGWHLMVVRQEPGRYVPPDTPWMVEFKQTHNQYLIKLTDAGSNRPTM
jgi:hypothetical protein